MDRLVLDFSSRSEGASSLDGLNTLFRLEIARFGFTAHAAGWLRPYEPANPFILLNWPRTWLELYAAQGFAADDVAVREAMRSCETLTWGEIKARYPGESERIFAAAAHFGWSDGLVVPVHGPGTRRGIVSLAGADLDIGGDARQSVEAIALLSFQRAKAIREEGTPLELNFTRREKDVLELVAAGNSDEAIAAVLGISRATAHFHVENARRKLGAATRAQAVALALARKVIQL